jgi:hypothetical protein
MHRLALRAVMNLMAAVGAFSHLDGVGLLVNDSQATESCHSREHAVVAGF